MAKRRKSATKGRRKNRIFRKLSLLTLLVLVLGGVGARLWYDQQEANRQHEIRSQVFGSFNTYSAPLEKHADLDFIREMLDWVLPQRGFSVFADLDASDNYTIFGAPVSERSLIPIVKQGFMLGYCPDFEQPLWVAYRLHVDDRKEASPRPERFRPSPSVSNPVHPNDYTHSGYSRGHMAPSYAIGLYYGPEAQEETFYMTNIIPQKQVLNGGHWKTLEDNIANTYTVNFEEVWVIIGPVFASNPPSRLPSGRVAVPDKCFKIIVDMDEDEMRVLPFIIPQEPDKPLHDYLTTVDRIEEMTGLDFFSLLPEEVQAGIESYQPLRLW